MDPPFRAPLLCPGGREQSLGVRTDPVIFVVGEDGAGGTREPGALVDEAVPGERPVGEGSVVRGRQELAIFPLLSWYHASWDSEPNLPPGVRNDVTRH